MAVVTLSDGNAVTPADLAAFDATWMQKAARDQRLMEAESGLIDRVDQTVWKLAEATLAMSRLYELTRERRYLDHWREYLDRALKYRDDRHPGPPPAEDVFRGGRILPAWGGPSLNRAGRHCVSEVVSSLYAHTFAAFARTVFEDPGLHDTYGVDAMGFANAAMQTVWVFVPQVEYRKHDGFIEAYLANLKIFKTFPTAAQCDAAYESLLHDHPNDEAYLKRQLSNCRNLHEFAGLGGPQNENLAFGMAFIELWRALSTDYYRQSPLAAQDAEATRTLAPVLVSRLQRYFVNHLHTKTDDPRGPRFCWLYAPDVPADYRRAEDTSHGALDMRYWETLASNFAGLNVYPAANLEPIPFDDAAMTRCLANTFLQKAGGWVNFADNVKGEAAAPNDTDGERDTRNGTSDGWATLTAADGRVFHMCRSVWLRRKGDEQPYLTIGNHAALLAYKRHASRYAHHERSRAFGTPDANGSPAAIAFPALGVSILIYRDVQGRLHELWTKGDETGTGNLTHSAQDATPAASAPSPFINTVESLVISLYRGTDSHVHSLYWSSGQVGHDPLSSAAGAPVSDSTPTGFMEQDGTNVAVYRAHNGHLRSLWWKGPELPHPEDLTASAGAPPATGDPAAYLNSKTGERHVIYRGVNGHVYSLYWSTGAAQFEDLSAALGTPKAVGDPVAYYDPDHDSHQTTFRSADGHLHELRWNTTGPATWTNLTTAAGAPPAESDPAVYHEAGTNTRHVIYRGTGGELHDVSLTLGGAPSHVNLTRASGAPPATDAPAALTIPGPNTQHVFYRGLDRQIHEIRWT